MDPYGRRRELAHRSADGVDVTLFWDALDVFYHPYAYRREGHLAA